MWAARRFLSGPFLLNGDEGGGDATAFADQYVVGSAGRASIHPFKRHAHILDGNAQPRRFGTEPGAAADQQDVNGTGKGTDGSKVVGGKGRNVGDRPCRPAVGPDDDRTRDGFSRYAKPTVAIGLDHLAAWGNPRRDVETGNDTYGDALAAASWFARRGTFM